MINDFNEKGHPMVFKDEAINTNELKDKCRAAIASLTRQHGLAERLAESCFMIALSEMENCWKQRATAAEARVAELEKQEPIGTLINKFLANDPVAIAEAKEKGIPTRECYGRPAPAVNLAELVPVAIPKDVYLTIYDECGGFVDNCANATTIWQACRAAILRNIEGVK